MPDQLPVEPVSPTPMDPLAEHFHLQVGEQSIYVRWYPHGDPHAPLLIFLPGIATYVDLYQPLLQQLARQGMHVAALDYPGHGGSSGAQGRYRVSDICASVRVLIDRLAEQCGPVHLFGYSIGSLLAVAAAEADSRVTGVVTQTLLIPDSAPDSLHWLGWQWLRLSGPLLPDYPVSLRSLIDYPSLLADLPKGEQVANDTRLVMEYPLSTLASVFSHTCGIYRRRYPFRLTVLHGEQDEVLPLEYSRRLQRKLVQPMTLVPLPGGHMLPWTHCAVLVDAVRQAVFAKPSSQDASQDAF